MSEAPASVEFGRFRILPHGISNGLVGARDCVCRNHSQAPQSEVPDAISWVSLRSMPSQRPSRIVNTKVAARVTAMIARTTMPTLTSCANDSCRPSGTIANRRNPQHAEYHSRLEGSGWVAERTDGSSSTTEISRSVTCASRNHDPKVMGAVLPQNWPLTNFD